MEQVKKSKRSFIASEENIQDLKHPPTPKETKQSIEGKHKITTEAAWIIMNDNNKTKMIHHDDCRSDYINELKNK